MRDIIGLARFVGLGALLRRVPAPRVSTSNAVLYSSICPFQHALWAFHQQLFASDIHFD